MTFKKRIFFVLVTIVVLFVANIFISTGYFRNIENSFDGQIFHKVNLVGAEDIAISRVDSFAIISATARNVFPNKGQEVGGLYFLDLKSEKYEPVHLSKGFTGPFAPHGISIFKKDSAYTVAAINHTERGEFIEMFSLVGTKLTHQKTLRNQKIVSPNDVVLINEKQFYFTNDHKYKDGFKRMAEDYLGLSLSNVIYYDGENYFEVSRDIAYANGINFDQHRNLLFVASPRKFLVKVYYKNEDNSLTFIEDIPCNTGVDNIEFDEEHHLWIGAHPNLLHFAAYAKGKEQFSPSEIIKIKYTKKGVYLKEQIYINDGQEMSASTVAVPFGNLILSGNVMDDHFLILKRTIN